MLRNVAVAASWICGGVFLFAGLSKAIDPKGFTRHLNRLRLLPRKLLPSAAVAVAVFQCVLGAALLLRLWPGALLPGALGLTIALAALGYWSTASGRTEDCGCYNGLVSLSTRQSLLVDAALGSLLGLAWFLGEPRENPEAWRIAALPVTALLSGGLALASYLHASRHGSPLVDLSPLRIGRPFDPRWLDGKAAPSGTAIVVFLGATCPHCRKWVKVLNLAHRLADLPDVIGAVGTPEEELDDYRRLARFPIVSLQPWRMARLARGISPTAIVVRDGIIREKWAGAMPEAFAARLRDELLRPSSAAPRSDPPGRPGTPAGDWPDTRRFPAPAERSGN
jgi:hypothetical protein